MGFDQHRAQITAEWVDAATGEMKWMHSEDEGKRGEEAPRQLSGRGLAYWSDGRSARIIYVTPGYHLIALDAKTGEFLWARPTIYQNVMTDYFETMGIPVVEGRAFNSSDAAATT